MSILSYYLLSNISISILICFFSVLIVKLNTKADSLLSLPGLLCTVLTVTSRRTTLPDKQETAEVLPTPSGGPDNMTTDRNDDSETATLGEIDPQPAAQNMPTWTDAARVLNTMSGIFCVVCQLVATTVYFVMVATGSRIDTL
jgi:hypothetical protein